MPSSSETAPSRRSLSFFLPSLLGFYQSMGRSFTLSTGAVGLLVIVSKVSKSSVCDTVAVMTLPTSLCVRIKEVSVASVMDCHPQTLHR